MLRAEPPNSNVYKVEYKVKISSTSASYNININVIVNNNHVLYLAICCWHTQHFPLFTIM